LSCSELANTAINGASVDGKCLCKTGYSWDDTAKGCLCAAGTYLALNNICTSCKGRQGTVINGTTKDVVEACDCNATLNYQWDDATRSCICKPDGYYYRTSTKTCEPC
jgi:hypothetical protein